MKEEKEIPKTYYEKILVSSGEVPEQDKLKGEYVFIQKDGSITSLIFPCWMPEGFYEEHFESWLKPVPSPKQEAMEFADRVIKRCNKLLGTELYRLDEMYYPDDCVACYTLSDIYDKFKEKGD
jgi:hypothetical protein